MEYALRCDIWAAGWHCFCLLDLQMFNQHIWKSFTSWHPDYLTWGYQRVSLECVAYQARNLDSCRGKDAYLCNGECLSDIVRFDRVFTLLNDGLYRVEARVSTHQAKKACRLNWQSHWTLLLICQWLTYRAKIPTYRQLLKCAVNRIHDASQISLIGCIFRLCLSSQNDKPEPVFMRTSFSTISWHSWLFRWSKRPSNTYLFRRYFRSHYSASAHPSNAGIYYAGLVKLKHGWNMVGKPTKNWRRFRQTELLKRWWSILTALRGPMTCLFSIVYAPASLAICHWSCDGPWRPSLRLITSRYFLEWS